MVLEARPEVTQRIGEHEPGDAGASVDRGEDEQGLEHDREVVPEAHQVQARHQLVHDPGHAHREGRGAAGAGDDGVLPDGVGGAVQQLGGHAHPRQA